MTAGQDGWHANWKGDEVTDSVTFAPLSEPIFLPVAKWPD